MLSSCHTVELVGEDGSIAGCLQRLTLIGWQSEVCALPDLLIVSHKRDEGGYWMRGASHLKKLLCGY